MIAIYGLVDPDTGGIRYIGKSIRPLERLGNHLNDKSKCHRAHWLAGLVARGLRPQLVILEWLTESEDWKAAERTWIARGKSLGWMLTNNTDGGDGVAGLPAETRNRMAAVWRGRKHRPESLAKLKAARALRVCGDETRAKMSASQSGRRILWVDKIAVANRKLTDEQAATIRARIEAGEGVQALAREYGVHRTTLSKVKMGTYRVGKLKSVQPEQAVKNLATAGSTKQLSLLDVG